MSGGLDFYRVHDINSYTIQLVLCTYVQIVFPDLWEYNEPLEPLLVVKVVLVACWHRRGCRILQNINMHGG